MTIPNKGRYAPFSKEEYEQHILNSKREKPFKISLLRTIIMFSVAFFIILLGEYSKTSDLKPIQYTIGVFVSLWCYSFFKWQTNKSMLPISSIGMMCLIMFSIMFFCIGIAYNCLLIIIYLQNGRI